MVYENNHTALKFFRNYALASALNFLKGNLLINNFDILPTLLL